MPVFALSDAVAAGLLAFAGVTVTAICGLIGVLLNRSSKQDTGLGVLVERLETAFVEIDAMKERESHCLEALEWAHGRIVLLEQRVGLPSSNRPQILRSQQLRAPRRPHGS